MKYRLCSALLLSLAFSTASAQVASHAKPAPKANTGSATKNLSPILQVSGKPVVRVNDSVLTDRDLLREMLTIFPYARQHNGFPKSIEGELRAGALQMIIFKELVYQEAARRNLSVPIKRLKEAEAAYYKQFSTPQQLNQYLKLEVNGSRELLREKIRRSLLVDALLQAEVGDKATVSDADARAYYDSNPQRFQYPESFQFQSISIIPPENAGADVRQEARRRAEDALRQAKATKDYEEFGLLAEKVSEDDFRVNMGEHKKVNRDDLPPEIVKAALALKPGEVSDLLQFGENYTLFRLMAHTPAGRTPFEEVKNSLRSDMQKAKYDQLRAAFHKKLLEKAKVENLEQPAEQSALRK